MAEHTKGPWRISRNGLGGWNIGPERAATVARTGAFMPEAEANATLIAASPDLLAALIEARAMVEAWGAYAGEYFQAKWDLPGDLQTLDAAIAKSSPLTGEG